MVDPDPPDLSPFGLRIGEVRGKGGTGVVYAGTDVETAGRAVAIKLITSTEPHVLEALAREIDSIIQLRHPNIVTLLRARTSTAPRFLVYELLEPSPTSLPLTEEQAAEYGIKLCSGLATAHRAAIVHCDIKPANILWHADGEPLISDFGAARIDATTRFRHGLAYSPAWAPPWIRAIGPDGADPSSDVWSLAATLLALHLGDGSPAEPVDGSLTGVGEVLRSAMPATPPNGPVGSDRALELGRRLQEHQHRRGWSVTAFPGDRQRGWVIPPAQENRPTPETDRGDHTVARVGPPSQPPLGEAPPADERPGPAPVGRRRWPAVVLVGLLVVAATAAWLRWRPDPDPEQTVASRPTTGDEKIDPDASSTSTSSSTSTTSIPSTTSTDVTGEAEADADPDVESDKTTDIDDDGALLPARPLESPLAFASDRTGTLDIYTVEPGGTVERVVARNADDYAPSLSPDGSQIVFESNEGGLRSIYLAPADGSSAPQRLSAEGSEATAPTWSPDGSTIAWATRARSNWDIATYDVARAVETLMTTGTSDDLHPAWSPDGASLVFRSDRSGNGDIYRLDLGSLQLSRLTSAATVDDHPSWSTGGVVAFQARVNGDIEVFTVDALGVEAPIRRTTRAGFDGSPTFDGDRLVIIRRDGSESSIVMSPGPGESILETTAGLTSDLEGRPG